MQVADGILGQHGDTVGIDQLRNTMVDFRVDMVRTACQYNAPVSGLFHVLQGLFPLALDILADFRLLFPCLFGGGGNLLRRNVVVFSKLPDQSLLQDFLAFKGEERIEEINVSAVKLIDVVLDVFRVRGHDGAVVMIARVGEFIALIRHAGIEDELQSLADEPGHMTVGQFRRIALGLAGNGFNTQLVDLVRGSGREHYLVFQFGKEGVPERIILIEVQYTGNTDLAAGGLVRGQRLITEDPLVLVFIKVRDIVLVAFLADTALAAVAGDELAAAGKAVDGKTAVVGTALALGHGCRKFQIVDLVDRKHGSLHTLFIAFSCDESGAEGAHDARDVRADGLTAGDLLETAENGVIVKGSALDYDVLSKGGGVRDLDYLKQSVLDDGIGKAG